VPVMAGATNQSTLDTDGDSTMTSYKIAKPLEEVRKFYHEQMKAQGWATKESSLDKILQFGKAGRDVQVIISEESGGSSVVLAVGTAAADGSAAQPAPTKAATSQARATQRPVTATPEPSLVADIPVMAGAKVTEKGADYLVYAVAKPLVDVAEFYRSELAKAGWSLDDASDDGASLLFRKQGRAATLNCEENDGRTTVNLSVALE
jgi:hypothetical protein